MEVCAGCDPRAAFGIRAGCTGAAIGGGFASPEEIVADGIVLDRLVVDAGAVRARACFQAAIRLAISAATSGPEFREISKGLRSSKVAGGFAFSPELII